MKWIPFALVIVLLLSSCSTPQTPLPPTRTVPPPSPLPPPAAITPKPLSLDARPLTWFAPLPPLSLVEGRRFTGSDDFMKLFDPEADWKNAASHVQVFKLYGEWAAYKATNEELKQVVDDLKGRGIALAVEAGPLNAPGNCGSGVESFAGTQEGQTIARRIKNAGGKLTFIAMDEPYFFAHVYDGPNACKWDAQKVAKEIDNYVQTMKEMFPNVMVGDTEPLTGAANAQAYMDWMDTFRTVNGYDLAFIHMDIDWSRPTWADEVVAIETHGKEINIPVGIIYTGNVFDTTDEEWVRAAGQRVKKLELEKGGIPDHVLFQSWNDKPDFVLPETNHFTFTNFIDGYFENKSALGYPSQGEGGNLALNRPVHFSHNYENFVGGLAVDGDFGTLWNSGKPPRQWIEIDLGAEYTIKEIRLTTSQYPEGVTDHRVLVKGNNNGFYELVKFEGNTSDGQRLVFIPPEPVPGIRYVRVETLAGPSWVAWREIEVIGAGE